MLELSLKLLIIIFCTVFLLKETEEHLFLVIYDNINDIIQKILLQVCFTNILFAIWFTLEVDR